MWLLQAMLEEIRGNYKSLYSRIGVVGFVALIDTSMISPVVASYARSVGADAATAGLVAGIYSAIAIPMISLSGLISDRIGRKRLLAAGLAGDLIAMLSYALAASPLHLLLTRMLHAVCDSLIIPPALALLGDVFRVRVAGPLSIFWIFVAAAIVAGSGSASALVSAYGFWSVFAVVAALLLVSLISLRGLPSPTQRSGLKQPITHLLRRHWARIASSMTSILGMYLLIGAVVGSLPSMLIDRYGFTEPSAAAQIGIFIALSTAISIPVFPIAARVSARRTPLIPIYAGLTATITTALIMEYALGQVAGLFAAAALFSVALGSIIFSSSYLAVTLPAGVRGLGSGLNQSASLMGVALGAPLSATYVQASGHQGVFIVFGVLPAAAVLVFLAIVRGLLTRAAEAAEDV